MAKGNAQKKTSNSTATIGFEAKLWLAADKLRNNMDAAGFASLKSKLRDRRSQTLFIYACKLGTLIDRVHRELTDADLQKIFSTYHS